MIHPKIDSDELVTLKHANEMVLRERERCAGIALQMGAKAWCNIRLVRDANLQAACSAQDQIANRIAKAIRKGDE